MTWTWHPIGSGGGGLTFENFAIVDDTGTEITEIEEGQAMAVEFDAINESADEAGAKVAKIEYDTGQMADELVVLRPDVTSRESLGYTFDDGLETEQTYTITANGDAIGDLTVLPMTVAAVLQNTRAIGSNGGTLSSLDPADGSLNWEASTGQIYSMQSYSEADDAFYIGDYAGNVHAIDASDGTQIWSVDPSGVGDQIYAPTSYWNGVVYAHCYDGNLYALDPADGSTIWDNLPGYSYSAPVPVDGTLYLGGRDAVYALDEADGSMIWSYATSTSGSVHSTPVVVNGTVYLGLYADYKFLALDATDGSLVWEFQTGNSVFGSPAYYNGTLYFGSVDNSVYAVDAADGTEVWSYATGNDVWSSPTVVDGTVYVGSSDNTVYALNATDGSLEWSASDPTDEVRSAMAVVDGTVYAGSRDNTYYAFNKDDGTLEWSYATGGDIFYSNTIAGADGHCLVNRPGVNDNADPLSYF